jgi:hypothetical protein
MKRLIVLLLTACCFFVACNKTKTQESKISNSEKVRIVNIPSGKMIKTPEFEIGSEEFFQIMKKLWAQVVDRHEKDIFPREFMLFNDETGKNFWIYSITNLDTSKFDLEGFEIIDFEGGLYATATVIDPPYDNGVSLQKVLQELKDWVFQSENFDEDFSICPLKSHKYRCFMSQMPIADNEEFKNALGYEQLDIFIPIRIGKNPKE